MNYKGKIHTRIIGGRLCWAGINVEDNDLFVQYTPQELTDMIMKLNVTLKETSSEISEIIAVLKRSENLKLKLASPRL